MREGNGGGSELRGGPEGVMASGKGDPPPPIKGNFAVGFPS